MTVGIIGYLSARGLGSMTHDLRVQLGIKHQMVIPDAGWPYVNAWTTGNELYLDQWEVQREDLELWSQHFGIDTIVSIETPFGENTFKWAKELGLKTILIPMWESFNPNMQAYRNVDLYLCPSYICYQEIPFDNRRFLPWPIDTNEFKFQQRSGPAKEFVINAGSGGQNGRKGVKESIEGFLLSGPIELGIHLTVRSQVSLETILPADFYATTIASGACDEVISVVGPTPERAQQYEDGDVLLYCSKLDGHSLVGLEAMAAGLVIVTTDAVPMSELFKSRDLLVKVASRENAGMINPHCMANIVNVHDLAEKIRFCAMHNMTAISNENRRIACDEYSWDVLRPRWKKALGIA